MSAIRELSDHLRGFRSAPFLFVGSGLSRRYLGLEDFRGLLDAMASLTGKPLPYFVSRGEDRNPAIATAIAEELFEPWWNDPSFKPSRDAHAVLTGRESPLKVEVARRMDAFLERLPDAGPHREELDLLGKATIDGLITTNYDGLLESVFPDFRVFIGQDELLFSDVHGVGEIYKVHGCASRPESLVITERDYERFGRRNPYLAAKLLATFVERPVIFLGYSLGDPNVNDILMSISSVLTSETIGELRDRLVFVQWDPDAQEPQLVTNHMPLGADRLVPVLSLRVGDDFRELFSMLGDIPRKFPARLLRKLKEQVYELVLENDPAGRLAVVDIDDVEAEAHAVDVVFGVGIQEHLGLQGYVGLTREDVLVDVLRDRSVYRPGGVLRALPRIQGVVPLYRYLRASGMLDSGGNLKDDADVAPQVRIRAEEGITRFVPSTGLAVTGNRRLATTDGSLRDLLEKHGEKSVLYYFGSTPREDIDLAVLRKFLIEHRPTESILMSHWAKLICLYDFYSFGPGGSLGEGDADGV